MILIVLSTIAAYLVGSIPTGYIFARLLKGIDIRERGSGNVGATNVVRTIGLLPGVFVFIIDFLKGSFSVTLLPFAVRFLFVPEMEFDTFFYILLGSASIAGHIWTVFLKFKGGKGVATTAGVMAGMAPDVFFAGLVAWLVVFMLWRYVSLASIAAAVILPCFAVLKGKSVDFILFCSCLTMVGLFAHRTNIRRLIQGKEHKMVKTKNS